MRGAARRLRRQRELDAERAFVDEVGADQRDRGREQDEMEETASGPQVTVGEDLEQVVGPSRRSIRAA